MINRPTNVFDPSYYAQLQVWDAQQRAATDNKLARENWPTIANNWIQLASRDAEIGIVPPAAPAPPLMTVVADDGTVTHVPFPDLKAPAVPQLNIVQPAWFTAGTSSGSDKEDLIIAMLRAIGQKLGL